MLITWLLFIDFLLLAVAVGAYIYRSSRERRFLLTKAEGAVELQRQVYQTEVLREISDRIGYSLNTGKIVEIISSSIGNLFEFDTVSSLVLEKNGAAIFKCHIQNSVSHSFVGEVKDKVLGAFTEKLPQGSELKIDESLTGNLLNNKDQSPVGSFLNLPVEISGQLVGLVNISSKKKGLYGPQEVEVLKTIVNDAANAVSRLKDLLDSEKGKLAGIIFSLTDGVATFDLELNLTVYNPSVKNILEITADKDLTLYDIVDALAGKVDIRTKIEQALKEEHAIEVPELVLKNKALELVITPVKDKAGKKIGAAAVFRDITARKSLEKLRQEFTAMMVHELRAPLTAVRWSSESLLKNLAQAQNPSLDPSKLKDTMVTIETASSNMLELVNDLLDIAKIEAGKFELNETEQNVVEVINSQITAFKPQAEAKKLEIVYQGPEAYKLPFDKVRIAQVLANLLSNAIKYSDTGKIEVLIKPDAEKKELIVAVKDSGLGIAREDLSKLFSKFKQLESAAGRKGTGLGLVVTKGLVEAHGGRIWAESPGENLGSSFYFSLPFEGKQKLS